VEIIYTMMLCFVVLNCALGQNKDFAPLAIGFVLIAGAHAGGPISGGCFNPAVALAIDLSSIGLGFGWCIAYAGFECIGAALAAVLYRMVRPQEFGMEENVLAEKDGQKVLQPMVISELYGTFILTATVGLNVLSESKAGAWSIGAALMSMVYALGDVSGAHFNPAVTLAVMTIGRITNIKAILYIVSQLLGAIFGAWVFAMTYGWETFSLGPDGKHSWITRGMVDIFFTFLLCLTVLSVACVMATKKQDEYFGLAIGFAITAGGFVVASVAGGTMNPAVTLGIYTTGWLCDRCLGILGTLAYMLFEFLGGLLAAHVFVMCRPEEPHTLAKMKMPMPDLGNMFKRPEKKAPAEPPQPAHEYPEQMHPAHMPPEHMHPAHHMHPEQMHPAHMHPHHMHPMFSPPTAGFSHPAMHHGMHPSIYPTMDLSAHMHQAYGKGYIPSTGAVPATYGGAVPPTYGMGPFGTHVPTELVAAVPSTLGYGVAPQMMPTGPIPVMRSAPQVGAFGSGSYPTIVPQAYSTGAIPSTFGAGKGVPPTYGAVPMSSMVL
jgi:glycerol uptake facilitator-like aquaporin